MPAMISRNRVKVAIYLEPDVFWQLDESRNPKMSKSEYFASILTSSIGVKV